MSADVTPTCPSMTPSPAARVLQQAPQAWQSSLAGFALVGGVSLIPGLWASSGRSATGRGVQGTVAAQIRIRRQETEFRGRPGRVASDQRAGSRWNMTTEAELWR